MLTKKPQLLLIQQILLIKEINHQEKQDEVSMPANTQDF